MKLLYSALLYGALNHALYSHAGTVNHEAMLGACVSNLESEVLHTMANQTTGACYEDENGERIISEASYVQEVSSPALATKDVSPDLGVKQIIDSTKSTEIYKLLEQAQKYMVKEVMVDKKYDKVRDICENKNENCAFWAVLGEVSNCSLRDESFSSMRLLKMRVSVISNLWLSFMTLSVKTILPT